MSLVVSTIQVTGIATAYTVPPSKIAKVRLINIDSFDSGSYMYIGNYTAYNGTLANNLKSSNQGTGSAGGVGLSPPIIGFIRLGAHANEMGVDYMYIKEDHILVAGETVNCSDAGTTVSYLIFEEDA
jgi:hypothetical protein